MDPGDPIIRRTLQLPAKGSLVSAAADLRSVLNGSLLASLHGARRILLSAWRPRTRPRALHLGIHLF